jgi:small subunit ribosomal protein S5
MSGKEAEEKAKEKVEALEKQTEDAVEEAREEGAAEPEAVKETAEEEKAAAEKAEEPEEKPPEESAEETGAAEEEVTEEVKDKAEEEVSPEGQEDDDKVKEEPVKAFEWSPKTRLGHDVLSGKYKSLEEILKKGELILEPEIIDALIPDLKQEVIYIGGSPGKGGGIRRTATKMTARMHKSGRRFKLAALAVVGNGDGIVGIGKATSSEHRTALGKAAKNAKLNVIRVKRGCGSWECGCGGEHSVPFKVSGRSGSVEVSLLPAPKGVGIVASEEVKKILRLAGIKDAWVKTSGKTSTRTNLTMAFFEALKKLNSGKGEL